MRDPLPQLFPHWIWTKKSSKWNATFKRQNNKRKREEAAWHFHRPKDGQKLKKKKGTLNQGGDEKAKPTIRGLARLMKGIMATNKGINLNGNHKNNFLFINVKMNLLWINLRIWNKIILGISLGRSRPGGIFSGFHSIEEDKGRRKLKNWKGKCATPTCKWIINGQMNGE